MVDQDVPATAAGTAAPTGWRSWSPITQVLVGGGLLLGAFGIYQVYNDGNDSDNVSNQTCAMTAAAVPLFAEALTRGRAPSSLDSVGGVLTLGACKVALNDLQESPLQGVSLTVQADGAAVPQTVTAPDLTTSARTPGVFLSETIACVQAYGDETESLLRQMCFDGLIWPPG